MNKNFTSQTFDPIAMGERIRIRRKSLHLTQSELAARVGISLSFMGHIERGGRIASIETLVRIAAALDTTADSLLYNSGIILMNKKIQPELAFAEIFSIMRHALDLLEIRYYHMNSK